MNHFQTFSKNNTYHFSNLIPFKGRNGSMKLTNLVSQEKTIKCLLVMTTSNYTSKLTSFSMCLHILEQYGE